MRILIADDEHLARITLTSNIEELFTNFEIYEVSNGEELINQASNIRPHIAIVDINMPKFSGLEAIFALKDQLPLTQWIILTGYAQFDYAKEALQMGVCDYLLKPIRPTKLKEAIDKAINLYNKQINRHEAVFEQQVRDVLHGSKSNFDFYKSKLFLIHIENLSEKQMGLIKIKLKEQINNIFDNQFDNALLKITEKDLFVVVKHKKTEVKNYYSKELHSLLKEDSNLYFWIFESVIDKKNISFIESVNKLREYGNSWLAKECCSITQVENSTSKIPKTIIDSYMKINSTKSQIEKKNILERIINTLDNYAKENKKTANIIFTNIKSLLELDIINENDEDINYSTLLNKSPTLSPQIAEVVNYIDQHYHEDIGIKQISHLIGMSPNYLSAKFKSEMNMRFIDYLTKKRIDKACFLIKNSNLFIHNIANEVGFKDVKHFSKIFKKSKGCLPSEY